MGKAQLTIDSRKSIVLLTSKKFSTSKVRDFDFDYNVDHEAGKFSIVIHGYQGSKIIYSEHDDFTDSDRGKGKIGKLRIRGNTAESIMLKFTNSIGRGEEEPHCRFIINSFGFGDGKGKAISLEEFR